MTSEPPSGLGGEAEHVAAYLDFLRTALLEKLRALPEAESRRPVLTSGWTPLELLHHVAHVEQRWFVWGFLGEPIAAPWGDNHGGDPDAAWFVAPELGVEAVVAGVEAAGRRTREVVTGYPLDAIASTAGRFADSDPPDLRWICFHVLQELARHSGHLDVVVEVAGGPTGE